MQLQSVANVLAQKTIKNNLFFYNFIPGRCNCRVWPAFWRSRRSERCTCSTCIALSVCKRGKRTVEIYRFSNGLVERKMSF